MKNDILVSIITPCFNSEKTIKKTIESVLNQTYSNIEYFIIDGSSTDNTINIVKEYEPVFQGRMHIISEKDSGIYDAMNKGISLATGSLVGMVNSDDYYELDAVEAMVREMTNDKYLILYGFQRSLIDGKEKNVVLYNHNFLRDQMITHPTCFVTKSLYKDFGVFDTNYRSSADYDFVLKMLHNDKVVFKPVYKIISNFALGGMSSTNTGAKETLEIKLKYGYITPIKYKLRYISNAVMHFVRKAL
jgi:glycosyltransferase involved in cell wall biosynthesis